MSRPPLRVAMLACFVLGVAFMVPFDSPVTLTLGVLLLFASVALGLIAIAGPGSPTLQDDANERA